MITKTDQARPRHRYKIRGNAQQLLYPVAVERKYDGELEYLVVTDGGIVLFNKHGRTRTDMIITRKFEEQNLPVGTVMLAELMYESGRDFYGFLRHKLDDTLSMNLIVFDVLKIGTENYTARPYRMRRLHLEQLIHPSMLSSMDTAESYREVREIADLYIRDGYEGAVVKSTRGTLANARLNQAKVKKVVTYDLRIGNGIRGRNAVELRDRRNRLVCNVSTIGHEYVRSGMLVEVECTEVIQPSGKLRNPRIKCVRRDKLYADVIPPCDAFGDRPSVREMRELARRDPREFYRGEMPDNEIGGSAYGRDDER